MSIFSLSQQIDKLTYTRDHYKHQVDLLTAEIDILIEQKVIKTEELNMSGFNAIKLDESFEIDSRATRLPVQELVVSYLSVSGPRTFEDIEKHISSKYVKYNYIRSTLVTCLYRLLSRGVIYRDADILEHISIGKIGLVKVKNKNCHNSPPSGNQMNLSLFAHNTTKEGYIRWPRD